MKSVWTEVPDTNPRLYKHNVQAAIFLDRDPELMKDHNNVAAIIDTNAICADKYSLLQLIKSYPKIRFVAPQAVIDELDQSNKQKKKRNKDNKAVVALQEYSNFIIQPREHLLKLRQKYGNDPVNDNEILACCIEAKSEREDLVIFLITNDVNLSIKARGEKILGCKVSQFRSILGDQPNIAANKNSVNKKVQGPPMSKPVWISSMDTGEKTKWTSKIDVKKREERDEKPNTPPASPEPKPISFLTREQVMQFPFSSPDNLFYKMVLQFLFNYFRHHYTMKFTEANGVWEHAYGRKHASLASTCVKFYNMWNILFGHKGKRFEQAKKILKKMNEYIEEIEDCKKIVDESDIDKLEVSMEAIFLTFLELSVVLFFDLFHYFSGYFKSVYFFRVRHFHFIKNRLQNRLMEVLSVDFCEMMLLVAEPDRKSEIKNVNKFILEELSEIVPESKDDRFLSIFYDIKTQLVRIMEQMGIEKETLIQDEEKTLTVFKSLNDTIDKYTILYNAYDPTFTGEKDYSIHSRVDGFIQFVEDYAKLLTTTFRLDLNSNTLFIEHQKFKDDGRERFEYNCMLNARNRDNFSLNRADILIDLNEKFKELVNYYDLVMT